MKEIAKTNWYNNLIEDIRLLESTGIVATKHAIGKRTNNDAAIYKEIADWNGIEMSLMIDLRGSFMAVLSYYSVVDNSSHRP